MRESQIVVSLFLVVLVTHFQSEVLYRLARREVSIPRALLVACVFAFATSAWSVVSRALWQHAGASVLLPRRLDPPTPTRGA